MYFLKTKLENLLTILYNLGKSTASFLCGLFLVTIELLSYAGAVVDERRRRGGGGAKPQGGEK